MAHGDTKQTYHVNKIAENNTQKGRKNMTAQELAVLSERYGVEDVAKYNTVPAAEDETLEVSGPPTNTQRAKSMGLFKDTLSFFHIFTKNVDFTVNGTRFRGKDGLQVRGGAVPVGKGLVVDFTPVMMIGHVDQNEQTASKVQESAPAKIVVYNPMANYMSELDGEASVTVGSKDGKGFLDITSQKKVSIAAGTEGETIEGTGFDMDEREMRIADPVFNKDGQTEKLKEAKVNTSGIIVVKEDPVVETSKPKISEAWNEDSEQAKEDQIEKVQNMAGFAANTGLDFVTGAAGDAFTGVVTHFFGNIVDSDGAINIFSNEKSKTANEEEKEAKEEKEKKEKEGEVTLVKTLVQGMMPDFLTEMFPSLEDSKNKKAWEYAKKNIANYFTGKPVEEPPSDIYKEEEKEEKKKLPEIGIKVTLLPGLKAGIGLEPNFSIKLVPKLNIAPQEDAGSEMAGAAVNAFFDGIPEKRIEAYENMKAGEIKNRTKNAVVAAMDELQLTVAGSLSLAGEFDLTAMAYLLADASYLFNVKGGLFANIGLSGAGENNSLASIGVSQEIDFENGKPKFGDRSLDLQAGIGMSASIGVKAEIESKLFGIDKEFEKDFAEWDLFNLEYERAIKLNNTGASAGGFLKSQGEKDNLEDPWNNVGAVHSAFNASVIGKQIADVRKDSFGFRVVQRAEGVSDLIKKSGEANDEMKELLDGWQKLTTDPEAKLALEEDGNEDGEGTETKDKGDIEAQEREIIRKRLLYLAGSYAVKRDAISAQIKDIDSKIGDIRNSDHYKKNVGEAEQNVSKHTQLREQMKQWRANNLNATGAEALAAYRTFKGNGKSANFDKYAEARHNEEAHKAVGTKESILRYEKARMEELGKGHKDRIEKLDAYLTEHNLSKSDENENADFAAFYLGLGAKGMTKELARYVNKKEIVKDYEQDRYNQLTKKHTERIQKIHDFVKEKNLDMDTPSGELIEYYKQELDGGRIFKDVYANFADVDMIKKYEEQHLAEDKKTAWHYNIYIRLKSAKQQYDAAKTQEEKDRITEMARLIMFGTDGGETKGDNHYDIETFRKKSYRMAEKKDFIEYEKNWKAHGLIDTVFLDLVGGDLEEMERRMAENVEDQKFGSHVIAHFVLKKLGYEDPHDFVKKNIQLETILRYEKKKLKDYYEKNELEGYLKHQVCVEELTKAIQQMQNTKSPEARTEILERTRERYFSGEMRPRIMPTQRKGWLKQQVRDKEKELKFEAPYKKDDELKKNSSLMAIRNYEYEKYQYYIGEKKIKDADKHIKCVNAIDVALAEMQNKSAEEQASYAKKVKDDYFSGRMNQETGKTPKERKGFLEQVKEGNVDFESGHTAEGYIKSNVSLKDLQGVIDYEEKKVQEFKNDHVKKAKHQESLEQLAVAKEKILALMSEGKKDEAKLLTEKTIEDYCSGGLVEGRLVDVNERTELLSQAYKGRIEGEEGKFIDENLYAAMLREYQEHNGKEHEERAAALEKAAEKSDDAEVYDRYKQMGGGKRFRQEYNKQNETITAADLSIDQMMRYSAASLRKASKQGWLIRKKKAIVNFFRCKNPFTAGLSEEQMYSMVRAGHFGRLAMLIEETEEIKQAEDGSNAEEVEKQKEKIMQLYAEMTGDGGKGLAKEMENNLDKIVTPQMILRYENSRKDELGKKHMERLEWLEGKDDVLTEADMTEYRDMAKEDGTGWKDHANFILSLMNRHYQTGLDKALDPAQIMTPAAVYSYEERKYAESTEKHRERIEVLESTDETQEDIWEKYQQMGGGGAFLKSMKDNVKAKEEEYQGKSVDYQDIIDYEQARADMYIKRKELAEENVTKLLDQKKMLQHTLDESEPYMKEFESIAANGEDDTTSTENLNAMIERIMNLRKSKLDA